MEDYPAQYAGVMIDDEIVMVDDATTKTWSELKEAIASKKADLIELTVKREGELINISVTPRSEEIETPLGEKRDVGIIGVRPKGELLFIRHNVVEAFGLGLKKLLQLTAMTYKSLFFMATGKISAKEAVTGPIGIFHITKDAARYGFVAIVHLMAIISMSLAIVNLMPFPVLDGGHIFLLLLEKIRRKPLSVKLEDKIHQVGLYILLSLFIFIILNDFSRYGYWEKMARLLFGD